MEDFSILKQALPYIKQYRNKTFVIKFGGEVVSDAERMDALAADIALLHELNIRMVIIHGGGPQATELAERLGIVSEKVEGRRITDDRMLEVAKMVFAGKISTDILSHLRRHDTPGIGLSGVDGGLIDAVRRPPRAITDPVTGETREVDFQNVGDIRAVRPEALQVLLEKRFVPVVASLGADASGQVLNINADTIAAEIAAALPAEKLLLFSNVNGVLRDVGDPASRHSYLTVDAAEEMIRAKSVTGGMIPKLSAAILAVRKGVKRAHIMNGLERNALLCEVFTVKGLGTMIIDPRDEAEYLQQG
ncbi:MAG: acetylglutamate kinase [Planctomycetes bacterium]|nr:acetylglutamate kinase [Planctomycetota bacterium]